MARPITICPLLSFNDGNLAGRDMARRGRVWLGIVGVIVIVFIVVVAAVSVLVPKNAIRDRVVAAVHESTGRDLAINGGLSLTVFPAPGVSARDVTLSDAPWAGPQPMVSVNRLDIHLKLLPLVSGRVAADSFVLENPVINLRTDARGRHNWDFGTTRPAAGAPGAPQAGGRRLSAVTVGKVRIANGRLVYTGPDGKSETVDAVNVTINPPGPDQRLVADGAATWRARRIQMGLTAADGPALMRGGRSPVDVRLTSDLGNVSFHGAATAGNQPKADGDLAVGIASLREMAAWMSGAPPALPPPALGPFDLKSRMAVDGGHVALDDLQLHVDAIQASGALAVDTGGQRPRVRGGLSVGRLDLSPYLGGSPPAGEAAPGGAAAPWSDTPIDTHALGLIDADLALAANAIVAGKFAAGPTDLRLVLADGRLTADVTQMALYQGKASGRLVVDGSGPVLATSAQVTLAGLQAEPLLAAVAGTDAISGTAAAEANLTSRGRSQHELMAGLDGKGRLSFNNGTLKGVDLLAMVRDPTSAFIGPRAGRGTEFSDITGTFTIAQGLLRNDDLVLQAPALRLTGVGTVNLPDKSVNYRVVPHLSPAAQAQLGPTAAGVLATPVIIEGPWHNLTYRPDLSGAAAQQLGQLGGRVLGRVIGRKKGAQPGDGRLPIPIPIPPIPGLGR